MRAVFPAICSLFVASAFAQSPELLLQGRFGGAASEQSGFASLPVLFSWPSSSVYVTFNSTSITATLTALSSPATALFGRYGFYVDQRQVAVETITPNSTQIQWGLVRLGPGPHNLTITKLSEAAYGQATLETLTLGRSGRYVIAQMTSESDLQQA